MNSIAFFDTEIEPNSRRILDIGCIKEDDNRFHSNIVGSFINFLRGTQYACGHNIFKHDLIYIRNAIEDAGVEISNCIDTLFLSPLLFPKRPYHALLKDDKLQTDELNNPLNDSIKARDLFYDEVDAFEKLDSELKQIFYSLLKNRIEFRAFFRYIGYTHEEIDIEEVIRTKFPIQICEKANLIDIIKHNPVELAYCLALIYTNNRGSITPPWVLNNYPAFEHIMFLLRSNPCYDCSYCKAIFNKINALKYFFGFDSFRKYAGEPLQEKAVTAAINNKSLLAVFPTGGGKSLTFQLPALMSGVTSRGLTVVISPLQSLMKDQVDNLEKMQITEAVTINGLLDPIERAKSFERVENGSASILYISPESLRSRTIEHLLLGRNVARFVIDEAHCFSAWGQDFRVDYLYIAEFIKSLQEKKKLKNNIPVSCFTATAKQKVIEDICNYFKDKLSLDLEIFTSNASRTNLFYKVLEIKDDEEKYNTLRDLIQQKKCPTIVYVSRTKRADDLAERLTYDGFEAKPYHGKMDKKEKSENQDAFINGEVSIMVATSAFGMGVDKKDVGMVIHYDISDSLENYIQEAGRAGRDEAITADCYILFNDEDLSKHFLLLNQTKLSIQEIQQIWKAIKDLTRFRSKVCQSALEIGRKAGWDENIRDLETKVKTAINALEEAGYLKRGQNIPRVYADSILAKNAEDAINRINASNKFEENKRQNAIRIIKKLISCKSRKELGGEEAESRVDYISDHLGIVKEEVIEIINLLREEKILAYAKDLKAFILKRDNKNRSLRILKYFIHIEEFLLSILEDGENEFHIKKLNEQAEEIGCKDVTPNKIKTIFNFWAIKNWIKRKKVDYSNNHIAVLSNFEKDILERKLEKRYEIAQFIVEYLFQKAEEEDANKNLSDEDVLIEFSVFEIKDAFSKRVALIKTEISIDDIQDALFYLSRIEALKIEGGFLVIYNGLTIERLEKDNKIRYKNEDYLKLKEYYHNKVEQIHIVGEYANKMISEYMDALQFVDDYFRLDYNIFINKYFDTSRKKEIDKPITPSKFNKLFAELSPAQLKIINDNEAKYIVVAAGPGSGKTRLLVHKLASLLFMEDVKQEQLLMLTFSRAAATEFKKRLLSLIGNAANFVEIKTFHSYCFDLLGRVGSLEKVDNIIVDTINKIKNGEVEAGRITKTVLVIDEAQDMDAKEFELINTLIDYNEDMRVIAVGDDDQNIYEFRGASSKHMLYLIKEKNAIMYELIENYRSKSNLVNFSNQFSLLIPERLKRTPIQAIQKDNGMIKIVKYNRGKLITPLVNDFLSEKILGSTCILTKSNEEAEVITGLLIQNGVNARLIQSNDGFSLYNLIEIRFFLNQFNLDNNCRKISEDDWKNAKTKLITNFPVSINLDICMNIIKDFESTNTKTKYKSDLEVFIRESRLEDFYGDKQGTVYVSTIHKSKGTEYDNIFLMLDGFRIDSSEGKRQLYVAMTRAKENLIIHYNGNFLEYLKTEGLQRYNDNNTYSKPPYIAMQLSFKDVFLDYFMDKQQLISNLCSGDKLIINGGYCLNENGQKILKFSKRFIDRIYEMEKKNYYLSKARIRFIVYWKRENYDSEFKIILPEIYFEAK